MAWRYHGHAKVNPRNPNAFAFCDRCCFLYNKVDLVFQMEWRGDSLQSTGYLVCRRTCLDVPFEQNRPKRLSADPLPVSNPRANGFPIDEA